MRQMHVEIPSEQAAVKYITTASSATSESAGASLGASSWPLYDKKCHEQRNDVLWLIYIFSALSAAIAAYSVIALVQDARVIKTSVASKQQNRFALVVLLLIGILGLLSTLPGVLGGNWNWFSDKLFTLVSYVI